GIVFANNVWVASVGNGSFVLASSNDGKTWTNRSFSNSFQVANSVFYNSVNGFVAVGNGNPQLTWYASSPDGTTWTAGQDENATFSSPLSMTYFSAQNLWIACGIPKPGNSSLQYSSDFIYWTQISGLLLEKCWDITCN